MIAAKFYKLCRAVEGAHLDGGVNDPLLVDAEQVGAVQAVCLVRL